MLALARPPVRPLSRFTDATSLRWPSNAAALTATCLVSPLWPPPPHVRRWWPNRTDTVRFRSASLMGRRLSIERANQPALAEIGRVYLAQKRSHSLNSSRLDSTRLKSALFNSIQFNSNLPAIKRNLVQQRQQQQPQPLAAFWSALLLPLFGDYCGNCT